MIEWLRRRLKRQPAGQAVNTFFRAQKIARLLTTLSFYAEPNNYTIDSLLQRTSPVTRDNGKRARMALHMARDLKPDDD